MDQSEIVDQMNKKYDSFMNYINGLSQEDYNFRFEEKWSARQQIEHIVLCVKPLVRLFGMPLSMLQQNFEETERPNRSYQELKNEYLEKTGGSGKAPVKYVPEDKSSAQKNKLITKLKTLIEDLNSLVEQYDEQNLERFLIPHPLLGKITLKEMLYNAIYHVEHHQMQVEKNLLQK